MVVLTIGSGKGTRRLLQQQKKYQIIGKKSLEGGLQMRFEPLY
jgi:hypothetical protein